MCTRESKWPKQLTPLTQEEQRIADDWMQYWLGQLPQRYSFIDTWNHTYPVKNSQKDFLRTLEIGAGRGEHLLYECLSEEQEANYVMFDKRNIVADEIRSKFPSAQIVTGDCQNTLPYSDGYFDRILAIHVLEHLPNLPVAIKELYRVLDKDRGILSIVIPCEGGWMYELCRYISTRRIFEKRYNIPYKTIMSREHCNQSKEIIDELKKYFIIETSSFFPFKIKLSSINLIIGAVLHPKMQ